MITNASLRIDIDPGHGGFSYDYQVDVGDDPKVTATISRFSPVVGDRAFEPSRMTEVLAKGKEQVDAFLDKLVSEFGVLEWSDLKPSHACLHPRFHTFRFRDSAGKGHTFQYQIESSNHLDPRYKALIDEFEQFFEGRRLADAFLERSRRTASPQASSWWKFWQRS